MRLWYSSHCRIFSHLETSMLGLESSSSSILCEASSEGSEESVLLPRLIKAFVVRQCDKCQIPMRWHKL